MSISSNRNNRFFAIGILGRIIKNLDIPTVYYYFFKNNTTDPKFRITSILSKEGRGA